MAADIAKVSADYLLDEGKVAVEAGVKAAETDALVSEASVVVPKITDVSKLSTTELELLGNSTTIEENISLVESPANALDSSVFDENGIKREQLKFLSSIDEKTIQLLNNVNTNAITNAELYNTIRQAISSDARFSSEWYKIINLAKSCKTLLIGGIVITSTYEAVKWITTYIHDNNGPRKIYKRGKLKLNERIRSPYPCGFSNKNGRSTHPLNREILFATRGDVCNDWASFDACAGWASLAPNSRLSHLLAKDVLKKFSDIRLECRQISLSEAIGALSFEVTKNVASTVSKAIDGITSGFEFKNVKVILLALGSILSTLLILRSELRFVIKLVFITIVWLLFLSLVWLLQSSQQTL